MEKKSDAQLARKIEVALPVELSREDQITLLQKYIAENFTSAGMCADMAIHKKHVDGKTIIRESTVCCTNVTDSIENDLEIKRLFFSYKKCENLRFLPNILHFVRIIPINISTSCLMYRKAVLILY